VIALIASAGSGRGVDANDVTRRVRAAGAADVRTFPIQELDSVADTSPERIVVASGDGGVGPAAELAARLEVPLAVIPAGTANNFAAAAEIPTDLGQACRLAVTGERTRTMELGYAGDLPFINLASAGLAPVAGEKAARWKHALGPAAYTVGAAAAALTTPPIECQAFERRDRSLRLASGLGLGALAIVAPFVAEPLTGGSGAVRSSQCACGPACSKPVREDAVRA
jgi:hypothetical protein